MQSLYQMTKTNCTIARSSTVESHPDVGHTCAHSQPVMRCCLARHNTAAVRTRLPIHSCRHHVSISSAHRRPVPLQIHICLIGRLCTTSFPFLALLVDFLPSSPSYFLTIVFCPRDFALDLYLQSNDSHISLLHHQPGDQFLL